MRTGRKTIGFITPDIHFQNENRVWAALTREARVRDINLVSIVGSELKPNDATRANAPEIYRLLGPKEVDGVLVWASVLPGAATPDEVRDFIKGMGVPAVCVDDVIPGIPSISSDNHGGIYSGMEHMIKVHGKKRIAFLRGPETSMISEARFSGYKDSLRANGIDFDPSLTTPAADWNDTDAIKSIISGKIRDCDCIVSVSDYKAFTALEELRLAGIRVPEEIAVVGFDNDPRGQVLARPLTTVDPNHIGAVTRGLDLLMDAIKGGTLPAETIAPSRLMIRETCGCISAGIKGAKRRRSPETQKAKSETAGEERQLHEAFARAAASSGGESAFIHELEDMVEASVQSVEDEEAWHQRISGLRTNSSLLGIRFGKSEEIEDLLHQARVTVSLTAARKLALVTLNKDRFRNAFLDVCQSLASTHETDEIFSRCAAGFVRLGIRSFCIRLYADRENPSRGSATAVISQDGKTRIASDDKYGEATDTLLPEELLAGNESFRLTAMPLYFQKDRIGIILFGDGPDDGSVYELLRVQISSALKGAFLVAQLRHRSDILSKGLADLTLSLKGMVESSNAIVRSMSSQSSSVEEQAGAIEEMARNIKQIADMSAKSSMLSEEFRAAAGKGQQSVHDSVEAINKVAEHSNEIVNVLSIIRQIASQTNLLAMNAAIEAAHAGDAGRGFSIVADEVRRLSESTAKSVRDIQSSTTLIVNSIEAAAALGKDAHLSLTSIVQYAERTLEIASQLKSSMLEQETGVGEILLATHELLRITEEVNGSIKAQKDATVMFDRSLRTLEAETT